MLEVHRGPENLKKPMPKNSWNEINQFHGIFFSIFFFFLQVKFLFLWKIFKKSFFVKLIYLIFHEFFGLDYLKFSAPLWTYITSFVFLCNLVLNVKFQYVPPFTLICMYYLLKIYFHQNYSDTSQELFRRNLFSYWLLSQ